jgi:hypothetical protein
VFFVRVSCQLTPDWLKFGDKNIYLEDNFTKMGCWAKGITNYEGIPIDSDVRGDLAVAKTYFGGVGYEAQVLLVEICFIFIFPQ